MRDRNFWRLLRDNQGENRIASSRLSRNMASYFVAHGTTDHAQATHKAIVAVALRVRQQANIMAFSDTFYLLGVALLIALLASLFLRKPAHIDAGGAH
jgi:MFS transporter, DHA2 family, multidrug resistance protein